MSRLNISKGFSGKSQSVIANRDKYIGGSDLSQITNITTALSVAKKKLEPAKEFQSIYTEFGNIAEPLIRDRLSYIHHGGDKGYEEGVYIIERDGKLGLRGNLDIDDKYSEYVGEIKTVSEDIFGSKDWAKKLDNYKIQCGFYQMLAGYNNGFIATMPRPEYLIDKPFSDWTVSEMKNRQVEIEEYITAKLLDKLEITHTPLIDELKSEIERRIDLFDKAWEQLKNPVESTDILKEYAANEKLIKEYTERNAEILEQIAKANSDLTTWNVGEDTFVFTPASTSTRKSFDSRAFSKEHADLYNAYIKESTVNRKATIKIK